ncbi:MAG: dTDP-4-dehydrorhamnose 3,5-epimerase [Fidelibacterota bacterium]
MKLEQTRIPGILLLHPDLHADERGYFYEIYKASHFSKMGLPDHFIQDNQALSRKGVLRGLHYQLHQAQGKLVRVVEGTVFDVAVDIRKNSPTFGEWIGFELSADNHLQVFIPEGFAHGYFVMSPTAVFQYKCTREYTPEDEYGLNWNDPELAIEWPVGNKIVSPKDSALPTLAEINKAFLPQYIENSDIQ